MHSASDLSSEMGSDIEFEEQDMATPLPRRVIIQLSPRTPQDTPVKTPKNRTPRHSGSPKVSPRSQSRLYQSMPGIEPMEPSFIMPSMYKSTEAPYDGSPMRNSAHGLNMPNARHRRPLGRRTSSTKRTASRQTSISKMPLPTAPSTDAPQDPWHFVNLFWEHVLAPLLKYLFSILAIIAEFAKPLLALAAIAWLAFMAIQGGSSYVSNITTALQASVCIIPGSSFVFSGLCKYPEDDIPNLFPDFDAALEAQDVLRSIVHESKDAYKLPSTMKGTESTLRDLRVLIKYSTLQSRSELEVELTSFIDASSEAVRDLTRFNARVGHVIDQVISTNSWTMKILQGLEEDASSSGAVARFFSSLSPFGAAPIDVNEAIYNQYVKYISKIRDDISDLIIRAQAIDAILDHLNNQQQLIYEIAVRDGIAVDKSRDELFAQLWTRLGGNRGQRAELARTTSLIQTVHRNRRQAADNIRLTVDRLLQMQAALENLRDGTATPEVLGYRESLPLNYHIGAIGQHLGRLMDARGEARTLEQNAIRSALGEGTMEKALPASAGEMKTVYAN